MALDENILGKEIFTEMTSMDSAKTEEICVGLARVIINHIKLMGEVNVLVQTNTGSGTGTGKLT